MFSYYFWKELSGSRLQAAWTCGAQRQEASRSTTTRPRGGSGLWLWALTPPCCAQPLGLMFAWTEPMIEATGGRFAKLSCPRLWVEVLGVCHVKLSLYSNQSSINQPFFYCAKSSKKVISSHFPKTLTGVDLLMLIEFLFYKQKSRFWIVQTPTLNFI